MIRIWRRLKMVRAQSGRLRPALPEVRDMFQLKPRNISLLLLFLIPFINSSLFAQGYDDAFELKSKLKVELQYADYEEYLYPEAILYKFGVRQYRQDQPFLANFPEKRGLIKFSQLLDPTTSISGRYQYSEIKDDARQHFFEIKFTRNLSSSVTGIANVQLINDTRGYNAYQAGIGGSWNISPLTLIESDLQYYMRGSDAVVVGGKMNTVNFRFKIRQVLTLSTAAQFEYYFYNAKGDQIGFNSHTLSFWLSQFLPTETAIHLNLRYYDNTINISSLSPSIEVAQYIDWATVLHLKYRYYKNKSGNVSLGEEGVIIPDGLETNSWSAQINHEISSSLLGYIKYRYYTSNLDVKMHTYMLGFVYSF